MFRTITHVLLLAPCTLGLPAKSTGSSAKQTIGGSTESNAKGATVHDVTGGTAVLFENFEDEVYFQESTCCFYVKPTDNAISTPMAVALIATNRFNVCVKGICKLLPDGLGQ